MKKDKKVEPVRHLPAYTKRLKRELGIANIEFKEGASDKQLQRLLTKEEKRRDKADEPRIGATRYMVNVGGQDIQVDYLPCWLGDIIHIEFRSDGSNLISETGYRSYFDMRTPEECGITKDNVQEELQKLADRLAEEEKPKRATRRRREKRDENKKAREREEKLKKSQVSLF